MDYIIIGGDARMTALAARLRETGRRVRQTGAGGEDADALLAMPERINAADRVVVNCPPRARGLSLTLADVLAMANPASTVYTCGPGTPDIDDRRIVDLWLDEALLRENAWLTAEGALSAAMRAGRRCIRGAKCVVIGWGRVGGALTELLVALGARVTVVSRSEAHRHRAIERGDDHRSRQPALWRRSAGGVAARSAGLAGAGPARTLLSGERRGGARPGHPQV